jgi:ADP-heptose:LPS heptosyltransferase
MRALLVRLDGVGDAAVCTPLVASLRAAGHEVGVALTTRNAGLFAPDAIVAQHVLERIPWPAHGSTPASTAQARAEIAAQHYDVALIASEESEAYALARGVPLRVGFTTAWTRPLKNLWVRAQVTRTVARAQRMGADPHEVEVLYRLGAGLVAEPQPPREIARLRPLLLPAPVPPRADACVVLQAGAKWAAAGVGEDALQAMVAALGSRLRVVAAPQEQAAASAALGIEVETFPDLRAWMAALDASSAVITTDTGAAHVAGMLGVPVVDVFGDARFDAQVRRWHPWASPYRALRASELHGSAARAVIEAALHAI